MTKPAKQAPAETTTMPGEAGRPKESTASSPATSAETSASNEEWHVFVAQLKLSGVVKQLAMNCVLNNMSDAEFCLALATSKEPLLTKERETRLQEALCAYRGEDTRLKISIEETHLESPAAREERLLAERQADAESAIAGDSSVKAILDAFDAEVRPGSVQPVD